MLGSLHLPNLLKLRRGRQRPSLSPGPHYHRHPRRLPHLPQTMVVHSVMLQVCVARKRVIINQCAEKETQCDRQPVSKKTEFALRTMNYTSEWRQGCTCRQKTEGKKAAIDARF